MFHTDNQVEFKEVLRQFSDAACENYGSHAFAAGYLESLAVQMLRNLPKREQKEVIKDMIFATEKQKEQAANQKETV